MRRGRDLRDAQDREPAEAVAALLAGAVIPITARAAGGGRLFGSVPAADIVEAVRRQTAPWSTASTSSSHEPIKTVGTHVVPVQLLGEVDVELTVEVVAGLTRAPRCRAAASHRRASSAAVRMTAGVTAGSPVARAVRPHGCPPRPRPFPQE